MGGNYKGKGNVTPSAEFNFYDDPQAAKFVLEKLNTTKPICIITYELCWDHSPSWEWYDNLLKANTPKTNFLKLINSKMIENSKKVRFTSYPRETVGSYVEFIYYPTYDQLAMAVFLDKSVIKSSQPVYATVCADNGVCKGQMVVDWCNTYSMEPNVEIVTVF